MKSAFWCLVSLLVALGSGVAIGQEEAALEQRLVAALVRAEKAMPGVKARSDVVFMISQASRLTSRKASIELEKEIRDSRNAGWAEKTEYALWEIRNKPLPMIAKGTAVVADKVLPKPKVVLHADQKLVLVFVLIDRAIGCNASYNVYRDVGEPYFDYISAHQLLALMIARSHGCLTQTAFEKEVAPYVQRVYSEMIHHGGALTDLQVERAAFLALVGRSDLVRGDIIESLLRDQKSHGGWEYDMDPVHTSGLAYLLLSAVYAEQVQRAAR